MSKTKNNICRKIKNKLMVYLFFIVCIGVICCAGIITTIKELPTINSAIIVLLVVFLCIELILCKKFYILFYALKSNSYVNAIVQEIKKEECSGDEQGSYYNAYRVFVNYTYRKEKYKNVFWYALDDERTRITKVMDRLPRKGQHFKLLVNPRKPTKILSGKPSKEDL